LPIYPSGESSAAARSSMVTSNSSVDVPEKCASPVELDPQHKFSDAG
jgi:hypothetical protein